MNKFKVLDKPDRNNMRQGTKFTLINLITGEVLENLVSSYASGVGVDYRKTPTSGYTTVWFNETNVFIVEVAPRVLPQNWPPRTGDVWRSPMGLDYYVTGDANITNHGGSRQSLKNLISDVEQHDMKFVLVYRRPT